MPPRHRALQIACLVLAPLAFGAGRSAPAQQETADLTLAQLRAGFREPPAEARLRCYWWWLNGNTDKVTITHDLEEMKAKGFGGALLVDAGGADQNGNRAVPAGPAFASPAWIELYTHALQEADRLGLEITLNATSGWNLGGPQVTPEQAGKRLTGTRTQVMGGTAVSLRPAAPGTHEGFYRPVAVLAYPLRHGVVLAAQPAGPSLAVRSAAAESGSSMPNAASMLQADPAMPVDTPLEEVRDISAQLGEDGTLRWTAPPGDWEVLRIGYTAAGVPVSTSSGAWQGLAIDYLSQDAFNTYWDRTVAPLLEAAKPFHSLKYLAEDSWEIYEKGTNWTESFAEEFKKRRGYDPVPWLPVVAGRIVGDPDRSARFLTDLRRTVADLIVVNHYDLFAKRAADYGLGVQAESGGPHGLPIDALETFRHSAVPQTEFWSINPHRPRDTDRFFTKQAASAAHIYGQRFVSQEGETSIGPQWSESLAADLKPSFDMAITEGMNRLVWHEFTSSPAATGLPGQEYFAGTHLNPKVTWWDASPAFFTYLNRAQFLMQQGVAVNDLLYFYGDSVPNFARLKADDPAHVLPGYDYDVTDEDALLHTLRIEGGQLIGPSGVQWRALAMPASGRLSLSALERIAAYIRGGGTVVGLTPQSPTGLASAADAQTFHALVLAMWGEACSADAAHGYGSGLIYCTANAHAALGAMHIAPDVQPAASSPPQAAAFAGAFDYIHRRIGARDVYFVRNGSAKAGTYDVSFRTANRTVELWDGVTGETRRLPSTLAGAATRVAFDLPAFGSAFLVFSPESAEAAKPRLPSHTEPLRPAANPWSVTFQPGRGAPATPTHVTSLTSWTSWSDPGVRFFSGTATYTAQVAAPAASAGAHVLLHFTDVREIARVRVNGHDAGTVWAEPLTLRVDPWLHSGPNTLEIEVTNLWPNRIIGDLQPGTTRRYTATNITAYKADSPLLPSGLIGAVEWLVEP